MAEYYTLSTSTSGTSSVTWRAWNNQWYSSSTTNTTEVWMTWNNAYATYGTSRASVRRTQPTETPEQRAERETRDRERREQMRVQMEQQAKERQEAEERARLLLLDHLDPTQRESYEQHQHFDVLTRNGQRRYRVTRDQRVKLINPEGRVIKQYCIHPRMDVPAEDTALAQKLMLESEEDRFLRVANAS